MMSVSCQQVVFAVCNMDFQMTVCDWTMSCKVHSKYLALIGEKEKHSDAKKQVLQLRLLIQLNYFRYCTVAWNASGTEVRIMKNYKSYLDSQVNDIPRTTDYRIKKLGTKNKEVIFFQITLLLS